MNATVIWHDLECGSYDADLRLWLELAANYAPAPHRILDVGAGTGRVTLELARAGHTMTALDLDGELLTALELRAGGLPIETVRADARSFELGRRRFGLCIAPMQTLQLLGGEQSRDGFMRAARRHLGHQGILAVAIAASDDFEEFEWQDGDPYPLPDIVELDGSVFCSQPTAVRRQADRFLLERRRQIIAPGGERSHSYDRIMLDRLTAAEVQEAGKRAGLTPVGVRKVAPTTDHIGSQVVILGR